MPDAIELKVKGLDKLVKAFDKFPREIQLGILQAGREASNEILNTTGLRAYPPITTQRQAPNTPYYIRGVGTQYTTRNTGDSEKLGASWVRKQKGSFNFRITNSASYAKWVHGDEQAGRMAGFGWRKLSEVAKEKTRAINKIYQDWVNRTIRKLGL